MTAVGQQRRVDAIEAALAPAPQQVDHRELVPWIAHVSSEELCELDRICQRAADAGVGDLPVLDRLTWVSIVARAERRRLSGEPPVCP